MTGCSQYNRRWQSPCYSTTSHYRPTEAGVHRHMPETEHVLPRQLCLWYDMKVQLHQADTATPLIHSIHGIPTYIMQPISQRHQMPLDFSLQCYERNEMQFICHHCSCAFTWGVQSWWICLHRRPWHHAWAGGAGSCPAAGQQLLKKLPELTAGSRPHLSL